MITFSSFRLFVVVDIIAAWRFDWRGTNLQICLLTQFVNLEMEKRDWLAPTMAGTCSNMCPDGEIAERREFNQLHVRRPRRNLALPLSFRHSSRTR